MVSQFSETSSIQTFSPKRGNISSGFAKGFPSFALNTFIIR